jgi:hypothetical protein
MTRIQFDCTDDQHAHLEKIKKIGGFTTMKQLFAAGTTLLAFYHNEKNQNKKMVSIDSEGNINKEIFLE